MKRDLNVYEILRDRAKGKDVIWEAFKDICESSEVDIVKITEATKGDINIRCEHSATLLMLASWNYNINNGNIPNVELVKTLLVLGADVNIKCIPSHNMETGYTALMLASECGHLEVVKLLVEAGADVEAKVNKHYYIPQTLGSLEYPTYSNITALDIAMIYKHDDVVDYLKSLKRGQV